MDRSIDGWIDGLIDWLIDWLCHLRADCRQTGIKSSCNAPDEYGSTFNLYL